MDGKLNQRVSREDGKKWSKSGSTLKEELAEFDNKWISCVKKKDWGWAIEVMILLNEIRELGKEVLRNN